MSPEEARFAASVAAGFCAAVAALLCDWLRVSHWVALRINQRLEARLALGKLGPERLAGRKPRARRLRG